MDSLIKGLLEAGTPWGILCAALVFAVMVLWKRCNKLSDQLYELATNQLSVNIEHKQTLKQVEKDLDDITRRFRVP